MNDIQNTESTNETALADALYALRKVGSASTSDSPARIAEYLDSIQGELTRITATRS
ncbi:hypothetical protein [Streptomyces albus]|uniref:hypothetical protein n=1 Tax=Streptomyces albus TaxID=1888 RepID=UPI0014368226|nr:MULTISPECIES: hypothetical protein [Streptomyces]